MSRTLYKYKALILEGAFDDVDSLNLSYPCEGMVFVEVGRYKPTSEHLRVSIRNHIAKLQGVSPDRVSLDDSDYKAIPTITIP